VTYLVDTNVLLRAAQPSHPAHAAATGAVRNLLARGERLCVLPQNLIEFWAVATRPAVSNGLGLEVGEAAAGLDGLKVIFELLPDTPAIYLEWETLVRAHQVKGKEAHDARIAAAMLAHGVTHILTFNGCDFKRFAGVKAVDPADV
jgi:predicted nucleic acid-binding protein